MSNGCPQSFAVGPSGTYTMVQTQLALSQGWASDSYETAINFLDQIAEFTIDEIPINANFDPINNVTPFDKPPVPVVPELEFAVAATLPANPSLLTLDPLSFEDAPEFDLEQPTIVLPERPIDISAEDPGDPPPLSAITLPTEPDTTLPPVPLLKELELPNVPEIDLTEVLEQFQLTRASRPDLDPKILEGLGNDYIKNVGDSQAAIFDSVESNLQTINTAFGLWESGPNGVVSKTASTVADMLDGGLGMPAAIEQALFGRAADRLDKEANQAIDQAAIEWSSRGFTMPGNALVVQVQQAREQAAVQKAGAIRDIYIQNAQFEIENLRTAVMEGVKQEEQSFRHFVDLYGRAQDNANKAFDVGLAMFDLKVKLYQIQLDVYRTDLDAYKTWIEIELAQLEEFRARIELQRLIAEVNAQQVEIYKSRLEAVMIKVEIYKAQVEAVKSLVDIDVAKVRAYGEKVSAFRARVDIKQAEFDAYAKLVDAEVSRVGLYNAQVQAFATRITAYRTGVEAEISKEQLIISQNEAKIREFTAKLERYNRAVQAEAARVTAAASIFDGQARIFTAELGAEQARAVSDTREFELNIQQGQADAQLKLARASQLVQQAQRSAALELEAMSSGARVAAQLAASSMSAVNIGAHLQSSGTTSETNNCTTTYTFQGE